MRAQACQMCARKHEGAPECLPAVCTPMPTPDKVTPKHTLVECTPKHTAMSSHFAPCTAPLWPHVQLSTAPSAALHCPKRSFPPDLKPLQSPKQLDRVQKGTGQVAPRHMPTSPHSWHTAVHFGCFLLSDCTWPPQPQKKCEGISRPVLRSGHHSKADNARRVHTHGVCGRMHNWPCAQ